jgi:2-polyprenyl-6-methoxyphenol hydroxylase-like FAD-dependent oxidoreductase
MRSGGQSFDAIIIGAGQAGPSLAGRLTAAGMNVALVERKLCSSPQFATRPAAAGATNGGAPENEGVEHGR